MNSAKPKDQKVVSLPAIWVRPLKPHLFCLI